MTARGYGDEDFLALCNVVHRLGEARLAVTAALTQTVQAAPRFPRFVKAVRRLPTVRIELSDSAAGLEIAQFLRRRRWFLPATTAVSVLHLPDEPDDYLRGRRRQALRTNIRRAEVAGVAARKVNEAAELRRRIADLLSTRENAEYEPWLMRRVDPRAGEFYVAIGPDDATLALAVVTVDRSIARLAWMISSNRAGRSDARYLLFGEVVGDLIRRGVTVLLMDSAVFLPPGLIYLQRRLGFEPVNLAVRSAGTGRRTVADLLRRTVNSETLFMQYARGAVDRTLEAMTGSRTAGIADLPEATRRAAVFGDANKYEPSPHFALRQVVRAFGLEPAELSFVDVGCGRGRIVLDAAKLGFAAVFGVEIDPCLAEQARANLARTAPDRKASIVCADATAYQLPHGSFLVYLFNPFGAASMRSFLTSLECRARQGHKVYVAYRNATCRRLLDTSQCFRHVATLGGPHAYQQTALYVSLGHGS